MDRKMRVMIAKPGLDGHETGAKLIARTLRDAGMEVIYTGPRQTAEMIVESSDIWASIVGEKHRFYSKNLKSFIQYARRQASKYGIKGSRLNAAAEVLALLRSEDPENKLRAIWDRLPRLEHCYEAGRDPNGIRQYQICGKMFQETASIGYVIPVLEKFHDEYGRRARCAAENKNVDWKAVSHALRAAIQVKQIVTQNTIIFPLKEARFLMEVKEGCIDLIGSNLVEE